MNDKMTDAKISSIFEFTLPENVINCDMAYYTPPFASDFNAFWQLEYKSVSKKKFCNQSLNLVCCISYI